MRDRLALRRIEQPVTREEIGADARIVWKRELEDNRAEHVGLKKSGAEK